MFPSVQTYCRQNAYLPSTSRYVLNILIFPHPLQKGWTALVYACEHGHTEAVLALMSAGADCNVQTNVSELSCYAVHALPVC
jgi:ankyrin repeat protein